MLDLEFMRVEDLDLEFLESDRSKQPYLDKDGDRDDPDDFGLDRYLYWANAELMDIEEEGLDSEAHPNYYVFPKDMSELSELPEDYQSMDIDGPPLNTAHYPPPPVSTTAPPHFPPSTLFSNPTASLTKKENAKRRYRRSRNLKRKAGLNMKEREKDIKKLQKKIREAAEIFPVQLSAAETLKKSKPAYIGVKAKDVDLAELDKRTWINVPRQDVAKPPSTALVDSKGRIFAIRGTPSGTQTPENFADGLLKAMHELGKRRRAPKERDAGSKNKKNGCRGDYKIVTFGISHGTGQKQPTELRDMKDKVALDTYKSNKYVKSCAHHVKNFFQTWFPELFNYYEGNMSKLEKNENVRRPFENLPFMASTLNLGPQVVTDPHKDFKNLAFGQCAVVVMGDFNWKERGKVRLVEAGVEIEVAPGDILLIPSASITHYNTPIGPHETRYSITFYTAGQMFRWVRNGFKLNRDVTQQERDAVNKGGDENWKQGWDKYYINLDQIRNGSR